MGEIFKQSFSFCVISCKNNNELTVLSLRVEFVRCDKRKK
jgi:hypothetical protein